jgi:hypothetical protein
VIAGLLLFPRELGKLASGRRVLIALLFLAIGASPLLWYNLVQGGRTFGSNASLSIRELPTKLVALRKTVDGSMFFEFFVANSSTGSGPARETLLRRSAVAVWRVVPIHRNANEFSFLLAVALVPFLWRTTARKTLLFTLCLIAIIWFQMAVTIGAGTGPHHAVLIWPWPMFFIGVAYSEASLKLRSARTVVLPLLIGLLAAANVLLSNSYLAELIHNGPGPGWTDAIFPLADYLKSHSSVEVYSTDWGTTHSLRLLDRGTLRLQDATFTILKDRPDPGDTQFLCSMITRRDDLLISHTAGFEAFKGINARLAAIAARMGYRQHVITTISDHENRNVFEVFRFEKEK